MASFKHTHNELMGHHYSRHNPVLFHCNPLNVHVLERQANLHDQKCSGLTCGINIVKTRFLYKADEKVGDTPFGLFLVNTQK